MTGVQKAKVDVSIDPDQRADAAASSVLRGLLAVIADNVDGRDRATRTSSTCISCGSRSGARGRSSASCAGCFRRSSCPGSERTSGGCSARPASRVTSTSTSTSSGRWPSCCPRRSATDLEPMRQVLIEHRLAARERPRAGHCARAGPRSCWTTGSDCSSRWWSCRWRTGPTPRGRSPTSAASGSARSTAGSSRSGEAISDSSPAEDFHELRKKGKELRYLLELFGVQLFDEDVVGPLVDSLKDLQELLGRHQDREVQVAMVRSLTAEVAPRPGGGAACLAMGTLVARLRDDELAARRAFATSFAELAPRTAAARASATGFG